MPPGPTWSPQAASATGKRRSRARARSHTPRPDIASPHGRRHARPAAIGCPPRLSHAALSYWAGPRQTTPPLIEYSARAALIGGNAGCLLPASFRRQLHGALPPGVPPSLSDDWLSSRASPSHWWKTTSGGRFPDAAEGPGRAGAGSVMAAPLRDRLSFLSRVRTGAFGRWDGGGGLPGSDVTAYRRCHRCIPPPLASAAASHSPGRAGPAPGPRSSPQHRGPGRVRPSHAAPSSSSCRCCCGARPTTTPRAPGTCSRRSPVSFREQGARGRGVPRDREGIPGQGELPGAAPGPGGLWRPAGLAGGSRGTLGPGWDPVEGLNSWHLGAAAALLSRLDP